MTDTPPMTRGPEPVAIWKRVVASICYFLTVFFIGGYVIGALTGNTTSEGFQLSGWPALLLFAIIIAYFYVGRRRLGGTLWDRIFRISRPQPR
jgi:DMSO reductase anchor subunit